MRSTSDKLFGSISVKVIDRVKLGNSGLLKWIHLRAPAAERDAGNGSFRSFVFHGEKLRQRGAGSDPRPLSRAGTRIGPAAPLRGHQHSGNNGKTLQRRIKNSIPPPGTWDWRCNWRISSPLLKKRAALRAGV